MLDIKCSGTPYEIGVQHGRAARDQIHGSIAFYTAFFQLKIRKPWTEMEEVALKFTPYLERSWPYYVEEMQGVAYGAQVPYASILALNVRSEISFGIMSDGCTTFSLQTLTSSFLAQNWDWYNEQLPNVITLHINQPGKPKIIMVTEAGIIGKVGFNNVGVAVGLNAILAPGVDFEKLPVHLALRSVVECTSLEDARDLLLEIGVASACHITIADENSGAVGLECTSADIVLIRMENGVCAHTNHLVLPHAIPGIDLLKDSPFRLQRIQELACKLGASANIVDVAALLKDQENYPNAICRSLGEDDTIQTVFSIVMDCANPQARVKMGIPTEQGEEFDLSFVEAVVELKV